MADAYSGSYQHFDTDFAADTVADSSTEVETAFSAFRTAAVKRSVFPTLVLALRTDPVVAVLLHSAFSRSREIVRHTKRSIIRCSSSCSKLRLAHILHRALNHQLQEILFQFVHAPHQAVHFRDYYLTLGRFGAGAC